MSETSRQHMQELHAFRDGELSAFRRWRVARRLARDPRARRELAALGELGALLREQAESVGEPDLWEGIRARLPYAVRPEPLAGPLPDAPRAPIWAGAALATAVVAVVVATGMLSGDAPNVASVRWLDGRGKPVMVLRDDPEATIIWVIQQQPEQTTLGAGDAVV